VLHRTSQTFLQNLFPHKKQPHNKAPNYSCQHPETMLFDSCCSLFSYLLLIFRSKIFFIEHLCQRNRDPTQ
jgi:hypothetical protein